MTQLFATLQVMGFKLEDAVRRRFNDERGQTAAEYMGIIVIVAIIIAAIATSDLGKNLSKDITDKVQEIFNHK